MNSKLGKRKKRYEEYQANYVSQSPEKKKQMSKEKSKSYSEKLKGDPHKKQVALKRKIQNQSQGLNSSLKNVQQRGKALKKVLEAKSKGKTEVLIILLNYSVCKEKLPLPQIFHFKALWTFPK